MTNKETTKKEIQAEEVQFLGKELGDMFSEPEHNVAGYESINVELMNPIANSREAYEGWLKSAAYSSLL